MSTAIAVIGAALGDEGKGLMTDYHCSAQSAEQCLVIRYNGGAQAGHTVQTPSGHRHVFSHFGSGTFTNASTYLSEYFITNPVLFFQEHKKLLEKDQQPYVTIHPDSPVTTLYDMTINQLIESHRGNSAHGSCGVGINETMERHQHADFRITVADLVNQTHLKKRLEAIYHQWLPQRLQALGLGSLPDDGRDFLENLDVQDLFLSNVDYLLKHIKVVMMTAEMVASKTIVFEGAQGLLLDEYHPWFPHVTRSRTGLKNILHICKALKINSLDVYYMTRAYLTRHGAGPLPFGRNEPLYPGVVDKTNVPHQYQGTLRFAPLNLDLLQTTINNDWLHTQTADIICRRHLGVTCLDQVDEQVSYIYQNTMQHASSDVLLAKMRQVIQPESLLTSHGPTRETVKFSMQGASQSIVFDNIN